MHSNLPAACLVDGYKTCHKNFYPLGTEIVHSNLTARNSRVEGTTDVVFFGLQGTIQEFLIEHWNNTFFNRPKDVVVKQYQRRMDNYLGKGKVDCSWMYDLHDLGYLPVEIKALPEGSSVPLQVPILTITNTDKRFGHITNYLETLISCMTWGQITAATTARTYRRIFEKYAKETGISDTFFTNFQTHDFSFRGLHGPEQAARLGAAVLTSTFGTDTVVAIDYLEAFYGADSDKELVGVSVSASEHAVTCAGGMENERETYLRWMTEVFPTGILSCVCDSWDYWNTVTKIIPSLKNEILARDGKFVVRPDSGSPVLMVIGDKTAPVDSPEYKGSVECLWDTFGGTVNSAGFKELNPKIGLIYGDACTPPIVEQMLAGLKEKGFASNNIVIGAGSYSVGYSTRDTHGMAVKATYCEVEGLGRAIFKAPKTDNKKNSAKGILMVVNGADGAYELKQEVSWDEERSEGNQLKTVFKNGKLTRFETFADIRKRISVGL